MTMIDVHLQPPSLRKRYSKVWKVRCVGMARLLLYPVRAVMGTCGGPLLVSPDRNSTSDASVLGRRGGACSDCRCCRETRGCGELVHGACGGAARAR